MNYTGLADLTRSVIGYGSTGGTFGTATSFGLTSNSVGGSTNTGGTLGIGSSLGLTSGSVGGSSYDDFESTLDYTSTTKHSGGFGQMIFGAFFINHIENDANSGFMQAFVASLSVIIVSELGDKTFFIAAIMAMRHPRMLVFLGAISALILMTVLSAGFGWIATMVPRAYTYYLSAALFALFGIKMLRDGWKMDANEGQEELEEVQQDLRKRDDQYEKEAAMSLVDQEAARGAAAQASRRRAWVAVFRTFMQAASMTFLAEWGDRSQLATVILGAREDVFGVVLGGIIGHSLCTGLAVLGGRIVAQRISVRTVTIIGGVVFLVFAVSALFIDPNDA